MRLLVSSVTAILPPIISGTARPRAKINRTEANHTLNFRIPAALASSAAYTTIRVNVWATDEVEAPPTGVKTRPTVSALQPISWVVKTPYKVRYVRISYHTGTGISVIDDKVAQTAIVRAFDLLPTIPTDLSVADVPTWHTSVDIDSDDGMSDLLDHIEDQHNCTFLEWIVPWGDECPGADGAVWIGILPRSGSPAGLARGNTLVVGPSQLDIAHELGHTLNLHHVNPQLQCGVAPDQDREFDILPNGGAIRIGDALDPSGVLVLEGYDGLHDFMTYACKKWVSRDTWMLLFSKF